MHYILFNGPPFATGSSVCVLFPGKEYFFHFEHSLLYCSYLFSVEALMVFFFSVQFRMSIGVVLNRLIFYSVMLVRLFVCNLSLLRDTVPQHTLWSSVSYILSTPSPSVFHGP